MKIECLQHSSCARPVFLPSFYLWCYSRDKIYHSLPTFTYYKQWKAGQWEQGQWSTWWVHGKSARLFQPAKKLDYLEWKSNPRPSAFRANVLSTEPLSSTAGWVHEFYMNVPTLISREKQLSSHNTPGLVYHDDITMVTSWWHHCDVVIVSQREVMLSFLL